MGYISKMVNDKFTNFHMRTAFNYAELSKARRLKCGSVLVSPDNTRVLMIGYNGTASGFDNNCEYEHYENGELILTTKPEVIHAEANVILYCAKHGIKTDKCILYVTDSPCIECAKLIVTSGISKVFYSRKYRITDGIDYIKKFNLDIEQIIL